MSELFGGKMIFDLEELYFKKMSPIFVCSITNVLEVEKKNHGLILISNQSCAVVLIT